VELGKKLALGIDLTGATPVSGDGAAALDALIGYVRERR